MAKDELELSERKDKKIAGLGGLMVYENFKSLHRHQLD
jgi:hypothetical protein